MTTKQLLTRRRFLGAALTGVSAPFLLPSRVWSAGTGPNDRITIGCIGMGTQNRHLTGNLLRRPDCQVVAVCDVDRTRREAARQTVAAHYADRAGQSKHTGCRDYLDFRALLARNDIDAVVIATPDHWHAHISIAAARAGKDIYCEKPLCQSIREARAMVNAVRRHHRIFQTGSMQRSMTEFRRACELVRNGRLGRIHQIEVAVGGPSVWCNLPAEPTPAGLDWNLWLGPAPLRPYHSDLSPRGVHQHFPNWRLYVEYGGGMITDWGAHHFDIAQWALGMDESGPVDILPPIHPGATEGVRMIYANGTEVIHRHGNGVTFHGSEGKVHVNRGRFQTTPAELEEWRSGMGDVRLYASNDHIGDWLRAIHSRVPPICDVEIGARTVSVCHLVNLAYHHRQRLLWDPVSEEFVGGTGNRKWLDVPFPYRRPWKLEA
jgi:predicted dehydrogenase